MTELNVAVLMGGSTAEREVSLKSGAAVAEALVTLGHRVKKVNDIGQLQAITRPEVDVVFNVLHVFHPDFFIYHFSHCESVEVIVVKLLNVIPAGFIHCHFFLDIIWIVK